MSELEQLDAQVALGVRVAEFFDGPVGKYLRDKHDTYRAELLETLAHVDPDDPKAIRAVQNRILVIDQIDQWLEEAITQALSAHERLQQLEQED